MLSSHAPSLTYAHLVEVASAAVAALNNLVPTHGIAIDVRGRGYAPITDLTGVVHYEPFNDEARKKGYTPAVTIRIGGGAGDIWLRNVQIDDACVELLAQILAALGMAQINPRDLPVTRIGPAQGKFQGEVQVGVTPRGNLLIATVFNELSNRGVVEIEGKQAMLVGPAGPTWKLSKFFPKTLNNTPHLWIAAHIREAIAEFDIQVDASLGPLDKLRAALKLPQFRASAGGEGVRLTAAPSGELRLAFSANPPSDTLLQRVTAMICAAFDIQAGQLPKDWSRYGLVLASTERGNWLLSTIIENLDQASQSHTIGKSWQVVARDFSTSQGSVAETVLPAHLDTLSNIRVRMAEADAAMRAFVAAFELGSGASPPATEPVNAGVTRLASEATGTGDANRQVSIEQVLDRLPVDALGEVRLPLARVEFCCLSRTPDGSIRIIARAALLQSSEIALRMGYLANRYGHFMVTATEWANLPRQAKQAGVVAKIEDARFAEL